MEQELATGLGEGQIAEFVEDDEVDPGQMISEPTLSCVAGLGEAFDSTEPGEERSVGVEAWYGDAL